MPIEILMPALSPTMTEGNLARWLKKEGDEVRSGDVLAEIETDKATMEVEAVDDGRLGKILVPEGSEGIKVNQPIALLLGEGEDSGSLTAAPQPPAAEPPKPAAPEAETTKPAPHPSADAGPSLSPRARGEGGGEGQASSPAPAPTPVPAHAKPTAPAPDHGARLFASPLARRMAAQAGVDLAALRGSGPQGRIVKADIEAALSRGARPAPAAAPTAPQPQIARAAVPLAADAPFTEKPHSAMRRVIARRLTEAKQTVPHFYLTMDCRIDELLRARKALNAMSENNRISVNDFVVRAAALALRQVPAANASWREDATILWERADIAVAVALDDGLITPIVRGADQKGLAEIAAETRDLVARARTGKLKLEEFQGGTFSISNLGMFGVREFAAVINPPHGCILAVGAGEERPVVKDGQLAVATVMTCTLSCDHRVVDGAVGARFLAAFRRLVEEPVAMLL